MILNICRLVDIKSCVHISFKIIYKIYNLKVFCKHALFRLWTIHNYIENNIATFLRPQFFVLSDPDDVMLCVLPSYSGAEATLHIHLTLIEAFCLEVGIQVVKVDDVESLRKLLSSKFERSISRRSEEEDDDEDAYENDLERMDYNCLLVEVSDGLVVAHSRSHRRDHLTANCSPNRQQTPT